MQTGRVKIVAAVENNPNARKTYKRNIKVDRLYQDVRTIDYTDLQNEIDTVDIVIGGPPCQGFSNANRQHTTVISMNNRLVKEYVRAICELRPSAFVMENVAMLQSAVHRFMVDESDLADKRIMGLKDIQDDLLEILPAKYSFEGALEFVKNIKNIDIYTWTDSFYKIINLLYRFRINKEKFDKSLDKYCEKLLPKLQELEELYEEGEALSQPQKKEILMAKALQNYCDSKKCGFEIVVEAIEEPLFMQRALLRIKELTDNRVHIYEYKEHKGAIVARVKSYAVRDYIKCVLENKPYNYVLYENTLNAIDFGAPQKRERYIIVGVSTAVKKKYEPPPIEYTKGNYRTVRNAIGDIQDIPVSVSVDSSCVRLESHPHATGLEKELRGKLLYNHVATDTTDTALLRFKALKEGQNFHDLDPTLKTTYSNVDRTQNTIYMRLKYDEPCGTVVNVRKSMWIHPVLNRAISIREAARLQTFPDSFIFEGTKDSQYQQIGNAVPPFLARAIAKSLIYLLDSENEDS